MATNAKIITTFEALEKLQKYCIYSDRCQFEIRNKLKLWQIDEISAESIIATLVETNFLNEERFATNFSHGKLVINHWGKVKIKSALKRMQLSSRCIQIALNKLDDQEYTLILKKEAEKKFNQTKGLIAQRNQKTIQFLIGKGFEIELIKEIIFNIIKQ